jgi:hypothetical protein
MTIRLRMIKTKQIKNPILNGSELQIQTNGMTRTSAGSGNQIVETFQGLTT